MGQSFIKGKKIVKSVGQPNGELEHPQNLNQQKPDADKSDKNTRQMMQPKKDFEDSLQKLIVVDPKGRCVEVHIRPSDTIKTLKEKIK